MEWNGDTYDFLFYMDVCIVNVSACALCGFGECLNVCMNVCNMIRCV